MKMYNNFSVWVAALVGLWFVDLVPFSPLFLVLTNLIWVSFFVLRQYDIKLTWVGLLLILLHAKPVYFMRHHDLDIPESVIFFAVYNVFLLLQRTNVYREYSKKYTGGPTNIIQFIHQA